MRHLSLSFAASLILFASFVAAAALWQRHVSAHPLATTVKTGYITQPETWRRRDSPFILTNDVVVSPSAVLTIEPGAIVKGQSGTELRIVGELQATGTLTDPIVFTSEQNSGMGQWSGLVFDGGKGHLKHTAVRYGGQVNSLGVLSNISIRDTPATSPIIIEDSYVITTTAYGIYANNATLALTRTTFFDNGTDPGGHYVIYTAGDSESLSLEENIFRTNARNRIRLDGGTITVATPGEELYANGSDTVWTLAPQQGLEGYEVGAMWLIPPDHTLKVWPHTTVMGTTVGGLHIQGHLEAVGTETAPITFTSSLNQDKEEWVGMFFDGTRGEGTGTLTYVKAGRAGSKNPLTSGFSNIIAYKVANGSVSIKNSTLFNSANYGFLGNDKPDRAVHAIDSNVSLENVIVEQNGNTDKDYALLGDGGETKVTVLGSLIRNNGGIGVGIKQGVMHIESSKIESNYDGIRFEGGSIVITNCSILDNNVYAIRNPASQEIDASYNWWGSADGPYTSTTPSPTPPPTPTPPEQNLLDEQVLYDPWLQSPPVTPTPTVTPQSHDPTTVFLPLVYKE